MELRRKKILPERFPWWGRKHSTPDPTRNSEILFKVKQRASRLFRLQGSHRRDSAFAFVERTLSLPEAILYTWSTACLLLIHERSIRQTSKVSQCSKTHRLPRYMVHKAPMESC